MTATIIQTNYFQMWQESQEQFLVWRTYHYKFMVMQLDLKHKILKNWDKGYQQ